MIKLHRCFFPVVFCALLLSACGGGGGGGYGSGPATAGIDGTGARSPVVASGPVTGFGSVIVNGVHYETNSTRFTIDGASGSQDDLAVGDIVIVRGELNRDDSSRGTATSIEFDDLVEGPISAIDSALNTITVLGQTVRIGADTSFDDSIQPASIAGLAISDVVEISGLTVSDGSISATRIEPKPASAQFELTGLVTALDAGNSRFNIGNQVVDYASAMIEDFAGGTIANGDLVEVKAGTTLGGGGALLATRVEFKGDDFNGEDGDRVEIEGFISRFVDITDFDISNVAVTTNGSPAITGGVVGDLGLDVKVEAEGTFVGGEFVATRIDIRRSNGVRVVANVDSVNAAGNSFVVLGITVRVDPLTRLEDKGPMDIENFSIDDLLVGDYVEVRGAELPAGSGELLASLLERDDPRSEVEVRGFVESGTVAEPTFEILGVTVTTGGGTVFRDASGNVISSASFFAAAAGRHVNVDGTEVSDQGILATQVEFE